MTLSTAENGTVTLGKDRHRVCLEVSYEVEALALVLPDLVPRTDEALVAHFAVRGIAGRLGTLANALMAALGDDVVKTGELEGKVMVSS